MDVNKHKCMSCYLWNLHCDQSELKEYDTIFNKCFQEAFDRIVQNPNARISDPTDEQFKEISEKALSKYHKKIEKKLGEENPNVGSLGKVALKFKLRITNETYNKIRNIDDASEGAVGRDGSFDVKTEALIPEHRLHGVIVTECPLYNLCAQEEN